MTKAEPASNVCAKSISQMVSEFEVEWEIQKSLAHTSLLLGVGTEALVKPDKAHCNGKGEGDDGKSGPKNEKG